MILSDFHPSHERKSQNMTIHTIPHTPAWYPWKRAKSWSYEPSKKSEWKSSLAPTPLEAAHIFRFIDEKQYATERWQAPSGPAQVGDTPALRGGVGGCAYWSGSGPHARTERPAHGGTRGAGWLWDWRRPGRRARRVHVRRGCVGGRQCAGSGLVGVNAVPLVVVKRPAGSLSLRTRRRACLSSGSSSRRKSTPARVLCVDQHRSRRDEMMARTALCQGSSWSAVE